VNPNVFIRARRDGREVYAWEGHNTWTAHGRQYLAQMVSYSTIGPDVPIIATSRLKHIAFGIGGKLQTLGAIPGDVATAYPAGFDPNATVGNTYDKDYPIFPLISTLERPVRISGGTNPYASAAPTDVWLTPTTAPKFLVTYPTTNSVSLRFFISTGAGDILYAPFTSVPVSEAGLVLSGDANIHAPFNLVAGYVNFSPLLLTSGLEVELAWVVSF